jgi:tetratricopeptide (TPR) repeat protein
MKFILLILFINLTGFELSSDSLNVNKDSIANKSLFTAKRLLHESQTTKAFKELLKAQNLYKATRNKQGESLVLTEFGKFYEKKQLWEQAETYYQKAFSLADQRDTTGTLAVLAYSLANTLYQQGKFKEALKFDTYALKDFTAKESKGKMAECYVQIAAIKKKPRRLR